MRTTLVLALVLLTPTAVAETGDPEAETPESSAMEEPAQPPEEAQPPQEADRVSRNAEALKRFAWRELGLPAGGRPRVWVGEPISLSLRDADLVEVLRSFAKMTDANLILDPSVEGKVTVELRDVPWDQALHVILKTHGLGMEISGSVWSLSPSAAPTR